MLTEENPTAETMKSDLRRRKTDVSQTTIDVDYVQLDVNFR
jgi:hypothetical protein